MLINCFTSLGSNEILAIMNIYDELLNEIRSYERDHLLYTVCIVREQEITLTNKPEELVRQALLHYLVNMSNIYPTLIDIKVEYCNVDLLIENRYLFSNFKPSQPPLLIVEIKRNDENLLDHENQLFEYLGEFRCSHGLLFNFKQMFLYSKDGDNFLRQRISNLTELENWILENTKLDIIELELFKKAQVGSFESFKKLVQKYKYSRVTFVSKDFNAPIEGFIFDFSEDTVNFDVVGLYSKKKKKFKPESFVKLISLLN